MTRDLVLVCFALFHLTKDSCLKIIILLNLFQYFSNQFKDSFKDNPVYIRFKIECEIVVNRSTFQDIPIMIAAL